MVENDVKEIEVNNVLGEKISIKYRIVEIDDRESNNLKYRNIVKIEFVDNKSERSCVVLLENPSKTDKNDLDQTTKNIFKICYNNYKTVVIFNVLPIYATDEGKLKKLLDENADKLEYEFDNNIKIISNYLKNNLEITDILLAYGNGVENQFFNDQLKKILEILSNDIHAPKLKCVELNKIKNGIRRPIHLSNRTNAINLYKDNNCQLLPLKIDDEKLVYDANKITLNQCIKMYFSDLNKGKEHRYLSFDYCYSYFSELDVTNDKHIEKSCYVLMCFLASWGMLRGSSVLLDKNVVSYKPIIEIIAEMKRNDKCKEKYENSYEYYLALDLDKENFSEKVADLIHDVFMDKIKKLYEKNNQKIGDIGIGLSKILMGLFGYPAFDQFVKKTYSINGFNHSSDKKEIEEQYKNIVNYYNKLSEKDKDIIKSYKKAILSFDGIDTGKIYSKAKLMDIYGFIKGRYL